MINETQNLRRKCFYGSLRDLSSHQVLESVVKNCGQTVHDEVASKQTMEELKDLFKVEFYYISSVIEDI